MNIGIITYVKCDNYGAELQAFALQWKLNNLGFNAEVIDLEKIEKDLSTNASSIIPALKNRINEYGVVKGGISFFKLIIDVLNRKCLAFKNRKNSKNKHLIFTKFFEDKIRHSNRHYKLAEIRNIKDLPYDTFIAGSDQIWNYMHTDYLDVYFLKFATKMNAKRISYAASLSAKTIPESIKPVYKELLQNLDFISVRETHGAKLLQELTDSKIEVVLDPTLLLTPADWKREVALNPVKEQHYIAVYTLSGSKYIDKLCQNIATRLGCKIIYMRGDYRNTRSENVINLYDLGPREWVGVLANADYVVTDSFHGTAFSINFNKPFTTLVNPASNMNSRVLSLLEMTNLTNRIIFDNSKNSYPEDLIIDYENVNKIISEQRNNSLIFLLKALK